MHYMITLYFESILAITALIWLPPVCVLLSFMRLLSSEKVLPQRLHKYVFFRCVLSYYFIWDNYYLKMSCHNSCIDMVSLQCLLLWHIGLFYQCALLWFIRKKYITMTALVWCLTSVCSPMPYICTISF